MKNPTRPHRPRANTLNELAAGLYADAKPMLESVVSESMGPVAWRPTRAAIQRIHADTVGRETWMTPAEFERWMTVEVLMARKAKTKVSAMEAVGLSPYLKLKIMRGERPVAKSEALAMAHYSAGRDLPTPIGDVEAFAAWFYPRFGSVSEIASWLEIRADYVGDRLRGYDIALGERKERTPDATLLRALDWVWTFGPWCPYGVQVIPTAYPGQEI